jgi:hypothetical protein
MVLSYGVLAIRQWTVKFMCCGDPYKTPTAETLTDETPAERKADQDVIATDETPTANDNEAWKAWRIGS